MNPVGITDTGKQRQNNEDSLFISETQFYGLPNLFIVADGMGGHNAGEVASTEAITFFKNYCAENHLKQNEFLDFLISGSVYANNGVYDMAHADYTYSGMGTTFSACVKYNNRLYIAHIGDSRIYATYDNEIKLITADHTYVFEMQRLGHLSEQDAKTHPRRNMLTRVLGIERDVKIDGQVFELTGCKKIVICSDGLNSMLSDDEILSETKYGNNEDIAKRLVDKANEKGGSDNITLIVFDAGGESG